MLKTQVWTPAQSMVEQKIVMCWNQQGFNEGTGESRVADLSGQNQNQNNLSIPGEKLFLFQMLRAK